VLAGTGSGHYLVRTSELLFRARGIKLSALAGVISSLAGNADCAAEAIKSQL